MIRLVRLTMTGQNVRSAQVDFGQELTVVRGPSDTGKSFIVDAIDFALGGSSLKEVPEREGYDNVMLGIAMADGDQFTLVRSVRGGRIGVYEEILNGRPDVPPSFTLAAKHNAATEDNLSRFLLREIGLDERRVRRNARNETDSLSFRNLSHLCVVDETAMQAETSPALTGSYISRTKEIAVLKLLLQGEDDSGLEPVPSRDDRVRTRAAKAEVLEGLISSLEQRLSETPEREALRDQLARLISTIESEAETFNGLIASRASAARTLSAAQNSLLALRERFSQTSSLKARLSLLKEQYTSDLARMELISEAGSLLGFFGTEICPACGSALGASHDVSGDHERHDVVASMASEIAKTSDLRDDLLITLGDLDEEIAQIRFEFAEGKDELEAHRIALQDVETQLAPSRSAARQLAETRRDIEKSLDVHDQLDDLRHRLTSLMAERAEETATAASMLSLSPVDEFSREMSALLAEWGFPDSSSVRYDRNEQDVVAGGQRRAAHGKGVRAILHAAFTIGLAEYCVSRGLPHPGFVVVDSPLVTYRPPDSSEDSPRSDDSLSPNLVANFYRSVHNAVSVQVIVMENTDPPSDLVDGHVDVVFTKSDHGRYGYFPIGIEPER